MAAKKKKSENFYMGNQNVPAKGSEFEYTPEMAAELVRCKEDVVYFAENYFTILRAGKGKELIQLYDAQKRLLKSMQDNSFVCLLASRQIGKSTLMTIFLLWMANFYGDQRIMLVANKEATAIEIFGRIRMAYELLPNWLKSPVSDSYGKTSMDLENGSRIIISTTTSTAGRGMAGNVLVIDECAFIESHLLDPFWASVFPIVSASEDPKIFMCSTPNGTGNLFHTTYTEAVDGVNGWKAEKILWSEIPGRDEKWVQKIKAGLASAEKFEQEYNCSFINTGTSGMNEQLYNKLKLELRDPIEILMDGKYKIWEMPDPNRLYLAGIDTSDGVGGDNSCIKILDITDLREIVEVAEFYDNMTPVPEFTNIAWDILCHWGKPICCIERNNQGGQVADRLAYDYGYDRLVSWGAKMAGRKSTQLIGMISQRNTKYNACANARYYYNDIEAVIFRNKDSLEEIFKDFVKVNDTWQAAAGKHDDRTMALVWALKAIDKDIVEEWFTLDEIDTCGKAVRVSPLDNGTTTFDRTTSIYNNEMVERIEESLLNPVVMGSLDFGDHEEISLLKEQGWEFLGGGSHYNDPKRNISRDSWETIDKWFG